jgi:hypothetical protein
MVFNRKLQNFILDLGLLQLWRTDSNVQSSHTKNSSSKQAGNLNKEK